MDYSEFFPDFDDFLKLVNTDHFEQEDLNFQIKFVKNNSFSSLEEYLKFFYDCSTIGIDIPAFKNDLLGNIEKGEPISGSLPLLRQKHFNSSLAEQIKTQRAIIDSLEIKVKNRILTFEKQLRKLFFILLIDKNKNKNTAMDFFLSALKDSEKQYAFIDPSSAEYIRECISYAESVYLKTSNDTLKSIISPNFYFPQKAYLLKPLHDLLLKNGFIEENENFLKLFKTQKRSDGIKPTVWLKDATQLFYLLFRLNNNNKYMGSTTIDVVANNLFVWDGSSDPDNVKKNFNKAFPQFENEYYKEKKGLLIDNILETVLTKE